MKSDTELPDDHKIAIIGFAGRFPGAEDVEALWRNLEDGKDTITHYSEEELLAAGIPKSSLELPGYVKAAGTISDPAMFDATFFQTSPKEAEYIDPQQRVFLECSQEALENAGCDSMSYRGRIGIFGGTAISRYQIAVITANAEELRSSDGLQTLFSTGVASDYLATRVAYKLKLRGPAATVQTACSSSLVAMHMAAKSILAGECEIALAGGVSIQASYRKSGYTYTESGMVSPDGRCRPFDAKAQGTIFTDGVGVIVLKRLDRALVDGDSIRAVIRGTAINNDGSEKVSFAAPGVPGQMAVIAEALEESRTPPESISFVEAHGTATALGDPIEFEALSRVYGSNGMDRGSCVLGSLKGNVGHLNHASGVAGIIKIAMAFEQEKIPGTANYEIPNPKIDLDNSVFRITKECVPWKRQDVPRRAGINNFGIGGTNVHAVLEEAPVQVVAPSERRWHILPVSGKSQPAADETLNNLGTHLASHPEISTADAAFTLTTGRATHKHARAVVCRDTAQATKIIRDWDVKSLVSGERRTSASVALMFPGQGSQRLGMGGSLYENEPVYREEVDRCAALFAKHIGIDLRPLLNAKEMSDAASATLTETRIAQPALFTVSYALAAYWTSLGIVPDALIGHSIGELVAATLAGVFSLQDATYLVAKRGELMQAQKPGVMSIVPASAEFVLEWLIEGVEIAAINGSGTCVVSGSVDAVASFEGKIREQGIFCTRLRTSHAFHSAAMAPAAAAFTKVVASVQCNAPKIPFVSNVTGAWITEQQATSPEYWGLQLRNAVQFYAGIEALRDRKLSIYIECGPGRSLTALSRQAFGSEAGNHVFIASMPSPDGSDAEASGLCRAVAQAWVSGAPVDLRVPYAGESRRKVPLSTYAFQRERYWAVRARKPQAETPSITKMPETIAECTYVPSWSLEPGSPAVEPSGVWWVFADDEPVSQRLIVLLRAKGVQTVVIRAAEAYSSSDGDNFAVSPASREHHTRLMADTSAANLWPDRIVYLWGASPQALRSPDALDLTFYGIVRLFQQLCESETPADLTVVTRGAFNVLGGEAVQPAAALSTGPVLTSILERLGMKARLIDLPNVVEKPNEVVAALIRYVAAASLNLINAYRNGRVWSAHVKAAPAIVSDTPASPVHEGGTYLLTGGFGDLAMAIIEELANHARINLVLVSRGGLPDRNEWDQIVQADPQGKNAVRISRIRAIELKGCKIMTASAEAGDLEAMRRVVDEARNRFGKISGVFHMAGIPGGSPMMLKDRAATQQVLSPKYFGTLHLEELFRGEKLDFIVLFSSIASLSGGIGQADYASGNAFMDAVANGGSLTCAERVVSINWDAWKDIGMAVTSELRPGMAEIWHEELKGFGISPADGLKALFSILASEHRQVLVSKRVLTNTDINPAGILNLRKPLPKARKAEAEAKVQATDSGQYKRPKISVAFVAPRSDIEKALAQHWGEALNIDSVGVDDDFFELGGHSLLALQLIPKLRTQFKIDFSARDIFEQAADTLTIARFAGLIEEKMMNRNIAQANSPAGEAAIHQLPAA
jgi:acyl transferase domain-containing protein